MESELLALLITDFQEDVVDSAFEFLSDSARSTLILGLTRAANNEIFTLIPILLSREERIRIGNYIRLKGWTFEPQLRLSLDDALRIVKEAGLRIATDVRFVCSEWIGGGPPFQLGGWLFTPGGSVEWKSFYSGNEIPVLIHPRALQNSDHVCQVILRAVTLLDKLRTMFEERGKVRCEELAKILAVDKPDALFLQAGELGRQWLKEHGL